MDKLESFEIVLKRMRLGEIVMIRKPQTVYFAFKGEAIQAKSDTSKYLLDLATFTDLFMNSEFFLYEKKEEGEIDKAKDDEYYQWKHK